MTYRSGFHFRSLSPFRSLPLPAHHHLLAVSNDLAPFAEHHPPSTYLRPTPVQTHPDAAVPFVVSFPVAPDVPDSLVLAVVVASNVVSAAFVPTAVEHVSVAVAAAAVALVVSVAPAVPASPAAPAAL